MSTFALDSLILSLQVKNLLILQACFLLMTLKKNERIILSYFEDEIDKTNLTDQTKFILNEITKIENYFNSD